MIFSCKIIYPGHSNLVHNPGHIRAMSCVECRYVEDRSFESAFLQTWENRKMGGLGLAIVKHITQGHGGYVTVYSTLEKEVLLKSACLISKGKQLDPGFNKPVRDKTGIYRRNSIYKVCPCLPGKTGIFQLLHCCRSDFSKAFAAIY